MFKWLLQQLCPLFPFKDFLFTRSFLSALVLVPSLLPFPLCLCCPAVLEPYCVIYILIISSCTWWAAGEH